MEQFVIFVVLLFLKVYVGDAVVMIIDYGTDVTMRCESVSASYRWTMLIDGSYQNLQNSSKYSVTGRSLTIHNTNLNDNGEYQCLLLRSDGSLSGGEIPIEIQVTVNGGWSIWSQWDKCTTTCGYGTRIRTRSCDNPLPTGGGLYCQGLNTESENCNTFQCPANGGWSIWSNWGLCTETCGYGTRERTRSCDNPLPTGGGLNCQGLNTDSENCNGIRCPVDGGWSYWGSWVDCTVTCGNGQKRRRRFCNNPIPANGGASCQGEEYHNNSCSLPACAEREQQPANILSVVGTVSGALVIVIVIILVVIYAKRRWYNSKQELDYEKTDITRVKAHIYGETHVNHTYQNNQQSAEIDDTSMENTYIDEANLTERCLVSDLTNRFRNKEYFVRSLRAEFKLLKNPARDLKPCDNEYEIVDTGIRKDVNQLNLNSSTLKVVYHNNVSVLLEIPQKNLAEQFWTIVDDHCIENVILLVQENEKVTEFYPTLDDIFRMKSFEIYLDSAERTNKNIMLLTFNLQNKTTQTMRNVKMFKTNVCESPPVEAMCYILGKASEVSDAPVLIINSKMADLSICGVLSVCLNVIYAIKNGSPFSVLENAMVANKNNKGFFKNFDDYELCYKVIENYLEAVHTYDFIE